MRAQPPETEADDLGDGVLRVLVACIGDMGTEPMAVAANSLVATFKPAVCINTGVTGSLHRSDMKIGDVMVRNSLRLRGLCSSLFHLSPSQIPSQVMNYTSNTKATDGNDGLNMVLGTRAFALPASIQDRLQRWQMSEYQSLWTARCAHDFGNIRKAIDELHAGGHDDGNVVRSMIRNQPVFELGHLASGNVLVASNIFKKKIMQIDRKIIACACRTHKCRCSHIHVVVCSITCGFQARWK